MTGLAVIVLMTISQQSPYFISKLKEKINLSLGGSLESLGAEMMYKEANESMDRTGKVWLKKDSAKLFLPVMQALCSKEAHLATAKTNRLKHDTHQWIALRHEPEWTSPK